MSQLDQLRDKLEAAKQCKHSLKTDKARENAWKVVRDIKHEILTILCAQRDAFARHSVKGTIRRFHYGDDSVSVRTPYGTLDASPATDGVSKSWYGTTCCVNYVEGQSVILELDVDIDFESLCLMVIPKRIYGGTLDEVRYAELCKRTDLAFFKYPGADGVTGLFASSKIP